MNFCEFRCFQVNPSPASRELPLHKGAYELVRFSAWCAEKTKEFFRTSKAKVCTFFLCGSAVFHHKPSSGRKVSRVSVTEGARETEKRQKLSVLHFRWFFIFCFKKYSPLRRRGLYHTFISPFLSYGNDLVCPTRSRKQSRGALDGLIDWEGNAAVSCGAAPINRVVPIEISGSAASPPRRSVVTGFGNPRGEVPAFCR